MKHKIATVVLLASLLILVMVSLGTAPVNANGVTTWYVNAVTGNDSNDCVKSATACRTIQEALYDRAFPGDTIRVAAGTYYVEDLDITCPVTINGAGPGRTVIDGDWDDIVIDVWDDCTTSPNGQIAKPSRANPAKQAPVSKPLYKSDAQKTSDRAHATNLAPKGEGGACYSAGAKPVAMPVTISGVTIQHGYSYGDGGGIWNGWGLALSNVVIRDNEATGDDWGDGDGGGIYNQGCLVMNNFKFINNKADDDGGGLDTADNEYDYSANYSYHSGEAYLTGGQFFGNKAGEDGGGFGNEWGYAQLNNVTFDGNHADESDGGGIYAETPLALNNVTLKNNSAEDGGGIYQWYYYFDSVSGNNGGIFEGLLMNNVVIGLNTASHQGGGIFSAGPVSMNKGVITNNVASPGNGGGIFIRRPEASNQTFLGNSFMLKYTIVTTNKTENCVGPLADAGNNREPDRTNSCKFK